MPHGDNWVTRAGGGGGGRRVAGRPELAARVRREEAAAGGGIVGLREEQEGEGPGCNNGKVLCLMFSIFCKLCASGEGLVVIIEKCGYALAVPVCRYFLGAKDGRILIDLNSYLTVNGGKSQANSSQFCKHFIRIYAILFMSIHFVDDSSVGQWQIDSQFIASLRSCAHEACNFFL